MPRRPRIEVAGGLFHVTARRNVGTPLFVDDTDFDAFLRIVARAVDRFRWRCHAFCLMSNHYHLLLETPEPNRGVGMRHLNGSYAYRFNLRYDGVGHVFQGRYHATAINRDEHLLEASRYIVLNPVRAGLSAEPGGWRWSSYRATAGLAPVPSFLWISTILESFACEEGSRTAAYRAFVADAVHTAHAPGPGPVKREKAEALEPAAA